MTEIAGLQILGDSTDERGARVHRLKSVRQSSETLVRVLLPKDTSKQLRTIYVLPVVGLDPGVWGDALDEFLKHDLHNKFQVACVFPTFSKLPWFADHPTDKTLQQESYFLKDVVGFVEQTYPVQTERRGRFLLGFSKSGWGAWSILLRHPNHFEKAAAWDAPMMMEWPSKYGSQPIFGTKENFEKYQIAKLLRDKRPYLQASSRLILTGYGNFRDQHVACHELMQSKQIAHIYRDGPKRKHHWSTGWVAETLELMLR